MPAPRCLDEDALHRYLFDETDRFQHVKVHQLELSENLLITNNSMTKILRRMESEGRIRLVSKGRYGQNTYFIKNPDGEDAPRKRRIVWG